MKYSQSGFTLIELIIVIVILGILAASVLPKFANLEDDALNAAAAGVAGSLSSAAAVNYAVRSLNSADGTAVDSCGDVKNALVGGTIAGGEGVSYSIADTAFGAANGDTTNCTVVATKGSLTVSKPFTGIRIN